MQYETKIEYNVFVKPPFAEENELASRLKSTFFDAKIFSAWQKTNGNAPLFLEELDLVTFVDFHRKNKRIILINSADYKKIQTIFEYTAHINDLMRVGYRNTTIKSKELFEASLERFRISDEANLVDYVELDNYLMRNKQGGLPFILVKPTTPQSVTLPHERMILLFFIAGIFVSVFAIFSKLLIKECLERLNLER